MPRARRSASSKTDRVGDCHQVGEILHQAGNHRPLSQLFDFLHNAVGIKTAANTYFNKEPKDLTVCEAAMLIGLCKNPSLFNPVRYPERAKARRNVVLSQMVKAGYLDRSEYEQYSNEPLTLNFHRTDHKDGSATYLREFLRQYMMAKRPARTDYPSWNYVQFVADSIAWDSDPLYGWCNKNFKKTEVLTMYIPMA